MAGSHAKLPIQDRPDAVLSSGLDLVRLLAEHLDYQVTVIDRDWTVIYSNHPALKDTGRKCYAAFFDRAESCSFCPAPEVFCSGRPAAVSEDPGAGGTEIRAVPLLSAEGHVEYVMEILTPREADSGAELPPGTPAPLATGAQLGGLVGASEPMQKLFEMIRLVADSQATVLLEGESGTGKELVARTIHGLSSRRDRPFVVVDCGSLPETLLESELFGHVKGAFTGATATKKGLFEEADGGTVLLDEIADTTPQFQAKLLRVLQEGEIKPVGSNRAVKISARVISATNKNLLDLVKARQFREDLYYRLAVLPLMLPALRERRDDIPPLVRHFIEQISIRHGKRVHPVAPDAMQALKEAPWPGNVRELKHTIERAVVTARGPRLTTEDFFPARAGQAVGETDLRTVARSATRHAERARIVEALRQASGKKAEAARLLKISRASLYNKLRAYDIE
jgi:two-component system response regulator AtoC